MTLNMIMQLFKKKEVTKHEESRAVVLSPKSEYIYVLINFCYLPHSTEYISCCASHFPCVMHALIYHYKQHLMLKLTLEREFNYYEVIMLKEYLHN